MASQPCHSWHVIRHLRADRILIGWHCESSSCSLVDSRLLWSASALGLERRDDDENFQVGGFWVVAGSGAVVRVRFRGQDNHGLCADDSRNSGWVINGRLQHRSANWSGGGRLPHKLGRLAYARVGVQGYHCAEWGWIQRRDHK